MSKRPVSANGGAMPATAPAATTRRAALRLVSGGAPASKPTLRVREPPTITNSADQPLTHWQILDMELRSARWYREHGNHKSAELFGWAAAEREAWLRFIGPWTPAESEAKARGVWGLPPGATVVH